jgi:hypothetical protein
MGNKTSGPDQYPVLLDNESNVMDDLKIANEFNKYFCEKISNIRKNMSSSGPVDVHDVKHIFQQEKSSQLSYLSSFTPCTELEVLNTLKSTGYKTSPSDCLPSNFLSHCCDDIIPYLTHLVNLSLSSGSLDHLKEAFVRPTPKNSNKPNPFDNYRPISELPFISKLIERIVLDRLNKHLTSNNLHNPNQFGYKKQHSCETLLTVFLNDVFLNTDSGKATLVIMCDLSAAFDTVDHNLLIKTLENTFLISDNSLKWFRSFLSSRTQKVVIRNSASSPRDILYGVPQGSVLGPVLFNLYTHSLSYTFSDCNFKSLSYADDTTGYLAFSIESQSTIESSVNECLGNIKTWMEKHFLKLNSSKTQVIIFGSSFIQKHLSIKCIPILDCLSSANNSTDNVIPILDKVKYLGVTLDNQLSLTSHVNSVCSQCYFHLRNINSIRRFISQHECESLVHAVVTSRLDYCNFLFFGATKTLLSKLQRIQNTAARLILRKSKRDSISSCLKQLHWLNIEQRSAFKLLILVYKCLHDSAPALLSCLLTPSSSSRSSSNLETTFHDTMYGRRAFSYCAPRLWNSIPLDIRTSSSLAVFKCNLKTYFFTSFHTVKCNYCQYAKLLK